MVLSAITLHLKKNVQLPYINAMASRKTVFSAAVSVLICPHATIRPFLLTEEEVANAPMEFETIGAMGKGVENLKYRIQVSPANCVGCGLCAVECPGKAGNKALGNG